MSATPGDHGMLAAQVGAMADAIVHRGPDDVRTWVDADAGVAFGHRRLAIVDLSNFGGVQPMVSADGRFVIAYNGEIYNAAEVARDLPQVNFRGHSDTEVLLEACAAWGVEDALEKCAGMFAFALWDRRDRRLWLVRDRIGIKPLYWTRRGGLLLFGSELKALRQHSAFRPNVDPAAVVSYLHHACVPGATSIFRGVHKLAPGHLLRVEADGRMETRCWWDLCKVAAEAQASTDDRPQADVDDALDALLGQVVADHLVSDVPLGAFLSGGIDSSTVVALMQVQSGRPTRTFSIGFRERRFNEADEARKVARHLETEHTELTVEPEDAQAVIPLLPDIYDEPFADSSQIPTFLVSQLARRHVTVALSGDGGDEGFAGYTRYHGIATLSRIAGVLPPPVRRMTARGLRMLSPAAWDALARWLPKRLIPSFFGDKMHKAAGVLAKPTPEGMYRQLIANWNEPAGVVPHAEESDVPRAGSPCMDREFPDTVAKLRYLDMQTYLPDDILTKVDRASMAVSLEARVPLLDHRVVEFAWRLSTSNLLRRGKGKLPLRRVLSRYVPEELFDRPKMGFGVPIGEWIRGPLRDYAEDLLSEDSLRAVGLLAPAPVRERLSEHLDGRRNWQYALWTALMLQAWARRWRATL